MQPIERAIWYIEHSFHSELSLDMVADAAGVSKYHLARGFTLATGMSVMRYVRGRRLSEAARQLAAGTDSIIAVALDAGYGSHEAFTRAFRDQFGRTPDQVRTARSTAELSLVEPIRMPQTQSKSLEPPRFDTRDAFTVAGIKQHYTAGNMAGIPSQWQTMAPFFGHINGQVGSTTYGVVAGGDDDGNVDYMTAVEVSHTDDLPKEFATLRIEKQRYAVFLHKGHITGIGGTWMAVFNHGLTDAGCTMVRAPQFELVDKRFDPMTGNGEIELWIPVEA